MTIINSGLEKEVDVLSYFMLHNKNKYIFYTEVNSKIVNLARVKEAEEKIILDTDLSEDMEDIRAIIETLISSNSNSFVFSKREYQYIDVENLTKPIEETKSQKIQLDEEKYNNFTNNKYLTYPYSNLSKLKRNKKAALIDIVSAITSGVILLLIIGGLIAYHFDWDILKSNIFDFDGLFNNLYSCSFYINNFLILKLAIVALVFSIISFGADQDHPFLFWLVGTVLLIVVYIIWALTNKYVDFGNEFYSFLKMISIYILFIGTIFTITYVLCKEVSLIITKTIKVGNFITYYTIYFILFTFSFIGLGLFYHYYLFEYTQKIVEKVL